MLFRVECAIFVCVLLAAICRVRGDTLADSVVDFSGVQGQVGWSYGYETTLGGALDMSSSDITYNPSLQEWVRTPEKDPPWTTIGQTLMHPNGTDSAPYDVEYADRRFSFAGPTATDVQITGHFSKVAGASGLGSGVDGYILLNGVQIDNFYSNDTTNQFVTPVNIPALHSGDVLDFMVGPNGPDYYDSTDFEVHLTAGSIAPLPSPAHCALALLGGLALLCTCRQHFRRALT